MQGAEKNNGMQTETSNIEAIVSKLFWSNWFKRLCVMSSLFKN